MGSLGAEGVYLLGGFRPDRSGAQGGDSAGDLVGTAQADSGQLWAFLYGLDRGVDHDPGPDLAVFAPGLHRYLVRLVHGHHFDAQVGPQGEGPHLVLQQAS